jgi:flagellar motor protein MotB
LNRPVPARAVSAPRSPVALAGPGLLACLLACGCGASAVRIGALDEMERVRETPAAREGAASAPEIFARAEAERAFAEAAHASRDDVAARLHAERAIAAYGHALVIARYAVAVAEHADAQRALDAATAEQLSLESSRTGLELQATELAERAQLAREHLLPAASADASGDREVARLSAARSLVAEARLLCGAARLVSTDAPGLAEAESGVGLLDAQLEARTAGKQATPIDDAGSARARCLDVLTRARRASGNDDGRADALLTELSASGDWDPVRDERGVVVTLRGAFRGAELSDDGRTRLLTLGQVAAAHPGFAVQVVVHAASPQPSLDAQRAEVTVKALVSAGTQSARVKAEQAGARVPVVDPSDASGRARNERLDVVFVAGS